VLISKQNALPMLMNNPVLFSFDSSTRTKNKLSLDLQNDAASGSTAEGVVLWVNQRRG
jgi:hypothetical protein